jgi:hypothetical protein
VGGRGGEENFHMYGDEGQLLFRNSRGRVSGLGENRSWQALLSLKPSLQLTLTSHTIRVFPLPFTSNRWMLSSQAQYCQAMPMYTIYDLITVMSSQTLKIVLCSEYLHLYNYLT